MPPLGEGHVRLTQTFLKLAFYLASGSVLAIITWGAISHSAVTGDHILSVILLGMMFFIIGQFFVDRWQPRHSARDFHPSKLWKVPQTTTRVGLAIRVGFTTIVHIGLFFILSSILVLTTTARFPFMILLGSLFILRVPHLYWTMRSYYEPVYVGGSAEPSRLLLRYRGGAVLSRRTRWLVPSAMAGVGGGWAIILLAVS